MPYTAPEKFRASHNAVVQPSSVALPETTCPQPLPLWYVKPAFTTIVNVPVDVAYGVPPDTALCVAEPPRLAATVALALFNMQMHQPQGERVQV